MGKSSIALWGAKELIELSSPGLTAEVERMQREDRSTADCRSGVIHSFQDVSCRTWLRIDRSCFILRRRIAARVRMIELITRFHRGSQPTTRLYFRTGV